jgi:hypothetical protein
MGIPEDRVKQRGRVDLAGTIAPRQGWEEAFRAAGSFTGDQLLLETLPSNEFDEGEWQW